MVNFVCLPWALFAPGLSQSVQQQDVQEWPLHSSMNALLPQLDLMSTALTSPAFVPTSFSSSLSLLELRRQHLSCAFTGACGCWSLSLVDTAAALQLG